jgi:hypothetical protein
MVIEIIHIEGVFAFEPEDQSPVAIDPERPESCKISTQFVEGPGRSIHLFGFLGNVQGGQKQLQASGMGGLDACLGAFLKKRLKSLVSKAPNHEVIVVCHVSLVNHGSRSVISGFVWKLLQRIPEETFCLPLPISRLSRASRDLIRKTLMAHGPVGKISNEKWMVCPKTSA